MRWPALLATLLLVVAPVASRLLEAEALWVPLCTSAGLQAALDSPSLHSAAHTAHGDASDAQRDHGPAHAACDYCLLAARLLPGLAIVLLLAATLPVPAAATPLRHRVHASVPWRAHCARGPPSVLQNALLFPAR
ncbi:DUF2946 family protein [Xanthomonas translucens]|uniref:DUF2946 family protein n=1 Tax=Xanthomonas campestris pv. translucens TaxID=343 RepID=UPI00034DD5FD|nr:DUF2946 family protein [Xanthomonas translucens]AVY67032.1 hypothetical protein NZ30_12080 [Xanthomonas translucens pv. undulosa]QSQ43594.1 DUF2946 family protein [Xanthomonas translucens pv. translucens]UKE45349.1 DUF2946 family protein [Xanthomonas translucens pv. secalis]MCT8281594.1 DUF2946 family protein [Xanthomonas translucens pv. undulosa]MCT8317213.1 DUF2946 family protein [Xanthomonas translucens pv. undulosa]